MLDPLQLYAHLEAQKSVRREFDPVPDRLWQKSSNAETHHRIEARARIAGWLRVIADRLEPARRGTVARSRA